MSGLSPILLFVKTPVEGRVKSRLAASLGDGPALELYRCFVLDILDTIAACGHEVIIFYDPPGQQDDITGWLGSGRDYRPQEGIDLGERMELAFRSAFSSGASRTILIGSDFPDLPAKILIEAFDELERHDAVLGPALDGGYYLIGSNRDGFRSEVFHNIPWSTSAVFEETMQVLSRTGAQVHLLPQWRDVDRIEDLHALYERNKGTAFEQSRTMPILRKVCDKIK